MALLDFRMPRRRERTWGTPLKPAWEPIIVAMKSLDSTFDKNPLKHGVAGFHVDAGRIPLLDGDRKVGAFGNGMLAYSGGRLSTGCRLSGDLPVSPGQERHRGADAGQTDRCTLRHDLADVVETVSSDAPPQRSLCNRIAEGQCLSFASNFLELQRLERLVRLLAKMPVCYPR